MNDRASHPPPGPVVDACRKGLAKRIRCECGGSAAAVAFAEKMLKGQPLTTQQILEVVAVAHRRLDDRLIAAGVPSEAHDVEWMLWGGQAGADWAESVQAVDVIEAELVSVTAEPATPIERLADTLARIDDTTRTRLAAAAEAAMMTAVSSTGRLAASILFAPRSSRKYQAQMVDALGPMAFEALKISMQSAPPELKGTLVPQCMRAVLDEREQDQIQRSLENSGASLLAELLRAQRDARQAIAEELEVPESTDTQVEDESANEALGFLLAGLAAVALVRLRSADPPTAEGPDGSLISLPPVSGNLVQTVLAIAGGVPGNSAGVVANFDDALLDARGRILPTGIATSVNTFRRLDSLLADSVVRLRLNIPPGAFATAVYTWRSTKREFGPHTRLAGSTWTTEDERLQVCRAPSSQWPYVNTYQANPRPDHQGCGCYIESKLVLGGTPQ